MGRKVVNCYRSPSPRYKTCECEGSGTLDTSLQRTLAGGDISQTDAVVVADPRGGAATVVNLPALASVNECHAVTVIVRDSTVGDGNIRLTSRDGPTSIEGVTGNLLLPNGTTIEIRRQATGEAASQWVVSGRSFNNGRTLTSAQISPGSYSEGFGTGLTATMAGVPAFVILTGMAAGVQAGLPYLEFGAATADTFTVLELGASSYLIRASATIGPSAGAVVITLAIFINGALFRSRLISADAAGSDFFFQVDALATLAPGDTVDLRVLGSVGLNTEDLDDVVMTLTALGD